MKPDSELKPDQRMKSARPILFSFICAVLLASAYELSRDTIESNQQAYRVTVLERMMGDAGLSFTEQPGGFIVYQGDERYGTIYQTSTQQGYNGEIGLFVAVTDKPSIIRLRVLNHMETPGLGDKIDRSVSNWVDRFDGMSIDPANEKNWRLRQDGGSFDGMSGATITSRALLNAAHDILKKETINMQSNL
mgnify:CR=1 FL=1